MVSHLYRKKNINYDEKLRENPYVLEYNSEENSDRLDYTVKVDKTPNYEAKQDEDLKISISEGNKLIEIWYEDPNCSFFFSRVVFDLRPYEAQGNIANIVNQSRPRKGKITEGYIEEIGEKIYYATRTPEGNVTILTNREKEDVGKGLGHIEKHIRI